MEYEIKKIAKCSKCFNGYFTDEIHTCSQYRRKKELSQQEGAIEVINLWYQHHDIPTIAKKFDVPAKEIHYLIRTGNITRRKNAKIDNRLK